MATACRRPARATAAAGSMSVPSAAANSLPAAAASALSTARSSPPLSMRLSRTPCGHRVGRLAGGQFPGVDGGHRRPHLEAGADDRLGQAVLPGADHRRERGVLAEHQPRQPAGRGARAVRRRKTGRQQPPGRLVRGDRPGAAAHRLHVVVGQSADGLGSRQQRGAQAVAPGHVAGTALGLEAGPGGDRVGQLDRVGVVTGHRHQPYAVGAFPRGGECGQRRVRYHEHAVHPLPRAGPQEGRGRVPGRGDHQDGRALGQPGQHRLRLQLLEAAGVQGRAALGPVATERDP